MDVIINKIEEIKPILASVEVIKEVKLHPNADSLEICQVLGYSIITRLGDYKVGDKICLIYPDSILPDEPWAAFYKAKGSRVKAIQLRGEWSYGIIESFKNVGLNIENFHEGDNITDFLNITKYIEPEPQDVNAYRSLPFGIAPTDETQYNKLYHDIPYGEIVDITLKIDGGSLQSYCKLLNENEVEKGITGRTLDYKLDSNCSHIRVGNKYHILELLEGFCRKNNVSLSIRGEIYGVGIQKNKNNPHSKLEENFALFSTWLIDERKQARKGHQFYIHNIAKELFLPTVPIIEKDVLLTHDLIEKYSNILTSVNGKPFEGVVIQHRYGSFKVINKYYDSKK